MFTNATPIIKLIQYIHANCYVTLLRNFEMCLTGDTRSIHVNTHAGGHTTHTNING